MPANIYRDDEAGYLVRTSEWALTDCQEPKGYERSLF